MNAYELAKQLEERHAPYEDDAANMLRQQADRIAELEKALEHEGISVGRDLLNGGVALSKKLPQTKPLSDDEIKEIADSVCYLIDKDKKDRTRGVMYIEDFARAIEERHGIK